MSITHRVIWGVMLVLAGHGVWATDQMALAPAASTRTPSPKIMVSTTDEALLKERVLARWRALIDRNFDVAYQFETPAYRAIYTPRQFLGQQGGQVNWRMAKTKDIHYDDPVIARVIIEIAIRYAEAGEDSQVQDLTQEVKETWLRKDGQWWHQPD